MLIATRGQKFFGATNVYMLERIRILGGVHVHLFKELFHVMKRFESSVRPEVGICELLIDFTVEKWKN
jgi:hypothetical protein